MAYRARRGCHSREGRAESEKREAGESAERARVKSLQVGAEHGTVRPASTTGTARTLPARRHLTRLSSCTEHYTG